MEILNNSKSNLAKLLATENITVEYRNAQTASFNVQSRTLTLPIWNDMTPEMTDLMIGHEVGHALDTPTEYGDDETQAYGKGFRTFLNVIEDARIERRIKDRYPGLKRSFSHGYREFLDRDLFKVKGKDMSKMLLIDRINLHFKIGPFFPIQFSPVETALVKRIATCDTFDEVITLAKEVYDYCKQELEEKREEAMQEFEARKAAGEFDDDMEGFDDIDDPFDDDMNGDVEYKNPDDYDADNSNDDFDDGFSDGAQEAQFEDHQPEELKQYDDEVKSATDENLQNALRSLTEQKEILNGTLPSTSQFVYDELIVSYKNLVGKVLTSDAYESDAFSFKEYSEFEVRNKNALAYLVKEFEMKKKAAELRRVTISDTGVIDTNKLHTYKFNDNIFRKVGAVAAGKNHGIVMFLDWSGSMQDNMKGTIEQLITLTAFCRKVNIPFEVYAFSTEYRKGTFDEKLPIKVKNVDGTLSLDNRWNLLNLFSSKMKTTEYRRMANDLLNYGNFVLSWYKQGFIRQGMSLGGTPLNQTIMASVGIVNNFRKAYKAEIVDVVFLTDGEDGNSEYTYASYDEVTYTRTCESKRIGPSSRHSISYVEDKESHKRYRVNEGGITPTLLEILKDKTGCNLIGFYVLPKQRRHFESAMIRLNQYPSQDNYAEFKVEKFFTIGNYGYDRYFLIPGGKDLEVNDDDLDDVLGENNSNVTVRRLKGAFLKMNKNRNTNRVLLSKIVEEIA